MPQHYVVTPDGVVRSYTKAASATAMGLQLNAAAAQDGKQQVAFIATDDDLSQVPTSVLVTLHNIIRPEKPVKKFSDRATAEKRMQGVLEVLAKPGEAPAADASQENDSMASKTKKSRARTTEGASAGRPSIFAGKIIRKVESKNPRKEGTKGFESWNVLKGGMTYEQYVAAGGRRQDLAWDLERNWVKLENA